MDPLRIVVSGFIALLPAGGVAWDYIQYPLCLASLGHDVYYIEDTGLWPVYQLSQGDPGRVNAAYVASLMGAFGLTERWAFRDEARGVWYGKKAPEVTAILESADVFINLSCANVLRETYLRIPVRILVDTDPMFTQIQLEQHSGLTKGAGGLADDFVRYTHYFTFGENMSGPGCLVPGCGVEWHPTRQPVALDWWADAGSAPPDFVASTVMNWSATGEVRHDGRDWGQKSREWSLISDLPASLPHCRFKVAVGQTAGDPFPVARARESGWTVLDANAAVPDWSSSRAFVSGSSAELSIAKHAYVAARTGWFSCRSACYLAAGRPVVLQDTGWSGHIGAGEGVLAFSTAEEARDAMEQVASDWARHARAARAVAAEYFDGGTVLRTLLSDAGVA
jgi:hypothetical protein